MGLKGRKKTRGAAAKDRTTGRSLLQELSGGDRRSIGRSNAVVKLVLAEPELFKVLVEGMLSDDPLVRMRAADAAEKVSAKHPDWLRPHKRELLRRVATIDQQEVRWHLAQMIPRLTLTPGERSRVERLLFGYLKDRSAVVKTFAIQALADLAEDDARSRRRVVGLLEDLVRTGSPALRSRSRKLLGKLR